MDTTSSPQPLAVGENHQNNVNLNHTDPTRTYAAQLRQKQSDATISKNDLCPVTVEHGELTINFTIDEVNEFTREEGLHQAVVMKFSYGKPDVQEVRRQFQSQFQIQGSFNVGQLEYRHLLIRFDVYADYVQFLSRSVGYLTFKGEEYMFRTFPWTLGFNPKEETSMSIVWISLPALPPNFFAKKSVMSIASAVGKPLVVDKATHDRTRPSTARVKVLIDLLDEHPTKVKLRVVDKSTGKYLVLYQDIIYDNLPKYCCCCKHQGHDEKTCRFLEKNTEEKNNNNDSNLPRNKENNDKRKKNGVTEKQSVQLQGDARLLLNAKRVSQGVGEIPSQEVNNDKQLMRNTRGNNTTGMDKSVADISIADAIVNKPAAERQEEARGELNIQTVIPAATVFARMNTSIDNGHISTDERIKAGATSSHVHALEGDTQNLGSIKTGNKAIHVDSKHEGNTTDRRGEEAIKRGNFSSVISSKKSTTRKDASTGQVSPGVRQNPIKNVTSLNKFDVLAFDKIEKPEVTIHHDSMKSTQLVSCNNTGQEEQSNVMVAKNLDTQQAALVKEVHSSNVPMVHFSNPNVEKIIKDAQAAMMQHTNMGRQPLVTLNTSVLEIPSQSERSFGENEGDSEQLLLSSGNNNVIVPRLWVDQDDDNEEDDEGESTDDDTFESEDQRSIGLMSLTKKGNRSKLDLNAPTFTPSRYSYVVPIVSSQEQKPVSQLLENKQHMLQQHHRPNSSTTVEDQNQEQHCRGNPAGEQRQQEELISRQQHQQHTSGNTTNGNQMQQKQPRAAAATTRSIQFVPDATADRTETAGTYDGQQQQHNAESQEGGQLQKQVQTQQNNCPNSRTTAEDGQIQNNFHTSNQGSPVTTQQPLESNSHVQQIIKQNQKDMIQSKLVKFFKPMVMLNTSTQDVPLHFLESCGEFGGDVSADNADQSDEEEESDFSSTEEEEDESDECDEDIASPASPSTPKMGSIPDCQSNSKLLVKAPHPKEGGQQVTQVRPRAGQQQQKNHTQEREDRENKTEITPVLQQKNFQISESVHKAGTNTTVQAVDEQQQHSGNLQVHVQTIASSSARNQPKRGTKIEILARTNEETNVRQLPMRVAKQKQVVSNASKINNRSKK